MRYRLPNNLVLFAALACLLGGLLIASGCSSETPKGGSLNKTNWVLTSYSVGGTMEEPPQGANGTAWFQDDKVTGHVVNTYQGTFIAGRKGDVTRSGPYEVTKMAGPPDLMAVEAAYLADLEKVTSYYSDGQTLTLYGEGDEKLIVYKATEGTVVGAWNVTAYNDGKKGLVPVISATTVTAVFTADGKMTGNGGIENYDASYTLPGGDAILITNISAPQLSGPQPVVDQQIAYLTALESVKTYAIDKNVLELRAAGGAIAVQMESAE